MYSLADLYYLLDSANVFIIFEVEVEVEVKVTVKFEKGKQFATHAK